MINLKHVTISSMHLSDLNEIKNILEKDFDDFWNYEIFKEELVNNNSNYLVLKYNDEIICFGGFKKIVDEADIMNIVTKKDKRNKGFAKLLFKELINLANNLNLNYITLEVDEHNKPAIHLYETFNFKQVGIRKNYYKSTGNNAILMTLDLNK